MLKRVLPDHQPLMLAPWPPPRSFITVLLYIAIPKGFFPLQDTGFVQGITLASPSISFAAMAEQQQAMDEVILKDPAVDSLTSFIGVDGTNDTLNSGRILINLKDKGDRDDIQTISCPHLPEGNRERHRHLALHAAGAGPDHGFHRQPRRLRILPRSR